MRNPEAVISRFSGKIGFINILQNSQENTSTVAGLYKEFIKRF